MGNADKLLNAFNRLHGDKDFKGSGIGLANIARVVRRHHGRIWADSTVDHGAVTSSRTTRNRYPPPPTSI